MSKIKWMGIMLAVSDLEKSKFFYETVMEQRVDFYAPASSEHVCGMVTFASGFNLLGLSILTNYDKLVSGEGLAKQPSGVKLEMKTKSNNVQLYFEVDDMDHWAAKLKSAEGIEFIHDIIEYDFGQRVMRFYDYDKHIVEVSEAIDVVAKRLKAQGFTVEEIAERFRDPVESIHKLLRT